MRVTTIRFHKKGMARSVLAGDERSRSNRYMTGGC